jgi:hypothetical protein
MMFGQVGGALDTCHSCAIWYDSIDVSIFEQTNTANARMPVRMIRYSLKCDQAHEFDAWFRSSAAYDEQRAVGHVACAVCGSTGVEKALMTPGVTGERKGESSGSGEAAPNLSKPGSPAEAVLAEMRRKVETTSDYVGKEFVAEARRIHDGESDKRAIWGEASLDDARALKDDGVPVAPIPWMRRTDG